jgi:Uma2 family endonuclease
VVNAGVVFEVLSPGTEDYDRGEKRLHYLRIEALRAYVLIAQIHNVSNCGVAAPHLVNGLTPSTGQAIRCHSRRLVTGYTATRLR